MTENKSFNKHQLESSNTRHEQDSTQAKSHSRWTQPGPRKVRLELARAQPAEDESNGKFRPTWAADMRARFEGTSRHSIRLKAAGMWKQQQPVNRSDAVPARRAPAWREGKNKQPWPSPTHPDGEPSGRPEGLLAWTESRKEKSEQRWNEIGSKKSVGEAKTRAENKFLSGANTETKQQLEMQTRRKSQINMNGTHEIQNQNFHWNKTRFTHTEFTVIPHSFD
jgi:hypothetical protein